MFDLYSNSSVRDDFVKGTNLSLEVDQLTDQQVIDQLKILKEELKDEMVVLGHHYQSDEIIQFADITGDSLHLSKIASNIDKKYIVFCGVHFMAETADILSKENQITILPDLSAGCSMADMASIQQVIHAWDVLHSIQDSKIVPVTYINCDAKLKAFVGKHDGSICTSTNAKEMITWALNRGEKLFFFPDQHLGRNTAHQLGISLEDMAVIDPSKSWCGQTKEKLREAKVYLWHGFCSVHQGFKMEHLNSIRKKYPDVKIITHPECEFDVVSSSDFSGSTSYIIDTIKNARPGTTWAVGTEINLVNRLKKTYPDKNIYSLSPYQCLCATMYRIRPKWLLQSFLSIKNKKPVNVIKVQPDIKNDALKALERMFENRIIT